MGEVMVVIGILGVYEGVLCFVINLSLIFCVYFVCYMVLIGIVCDVLGVFQYYLILGKFGYVDYCWVILVDVVGWIIMVGGVVVVVYFGCYKMFGGDMWCFFDDFKDLGGQGLEVICGSYLFDYVMYFV